MAEKSVSTQTLLFSVSSKGIIVSSDSSSFHGNSFTPVHTSIHVTASQFPCWAHLNWESITIKWQNILVESSLILFSDFSDILLPLRVKLLHTSRYSVCGYCMDEIKSTLFLFYMLVYSLWLPNGVKAYQKSHQSRRLSGAFMGCSSASRAAV